MDRVCLLHALSYSIPISSQESESINSFLGSPVEHGNENHDAEP